MIVNLYTFNKKKNSTAQPTGTGIVLSNVQLKDETSVINPIIIINPNSSGMPNPFTPSAYNYVYIQKFSRYYFITDMKWINGLWEMSLVVDVLGSFKTGIGSLSEYIVRSASSFDTSVSDIMYPVTTDYAVTKTLVDFALNTTGFYIVGLISNSSTVSEGAISYYIMSASEMASFKSYLMSETFLSVNGLSNLQDMNKELIKVVYNPYQYIVSCKFFPFDYPSSTGTAVTSVNLGWWSIPQTARQISGYNVFIKQSTNYTAPAHPQATRGRYLNHAPYTDIIVMNPIIGTVLLDSNKIEATNTVMATITCDSISGEAVIDITNTTRGLRLYEMVCNFALDIPLAQISQDVLGMARTAVDSVGNVVSKAQSLNVGGAIAAAGTGILNTIEASIPVLQSSGVNGNKANYYFPVDFYTVHRRIVDEDLSHKGRPLCQLKTISSLSGFIMCTDAHAELNCFDSERVDIENFMNTGFYFE